MRYCLNEQKALLFSVRYENAGENTSSVRLTVPAPSGLKPETLTLLRLASGAPAQRAGYCRAFEKDGVWFTELTLPGAGDYALAEHGNRSELGTILCSASDGFAAITLTPDPARLAAEGTGSKLVFASYDGDGRLLSVVSDSDPAATLRLSLSGAEKLRLFWIRADGIPVGRCWTASAATLSN